MIQLDGLSLRVLAARPDVNELRTAELATDPEDDTERRVFLSALLSPVVLRNMAPASRVETVPVEVLPDVMDATLERHLDLLPRAPEHDIFVLLLGASLLGAAGIRDALSRVGSERKKVVIGVSAHQPPTWLLDIAADCPRIFVVDASVGSAPMVRSQFESKLDFVTENLHHSPRVGVGLLLLEAQAGKFFFRQRTTDPEPDTLATIGGDLAKQQRISDELERLVRLFFGQEARAQIGPMLSCTSMTNGFYHYVDLTFLAVLDRDREPSQHATMRGKYRRPGGGYWYSASDTFEIWKLGTRTRTERLFQPVANAIEGFLRLVVASRAIHGPSQILVPSLTDPRATVLVPEESVRIGAALDGLALEQWSHAPLPFFEGGGIR